MVFYSIWISHFFYAFKEWFLRSISLRKEHQVYMVLQTVVLRGFPLYLDFAITGRRLRRSVKRTDVAILKIMKMKMMLTIIILRFINRVAFFPLLVCTSNTLDLLPCFKGEDYFEIPGADYMRRVGPVSQAGLVCWDLGTSEVPMKLFHFFDFWKVSPYVVSNWRVLRVRNDAKQFF